MISLLLTMVVSNAFAEPVSVDHLKGIIEHLASYGTRNTNTENCTKAAHWIADEFKKIPGLSVEIMSYPVVKGRRIVADKDVVQVVATLKGEDDRKIIIGGHFDTINLGGDPLTAIAPGANDDASGVALTMECARILAKQKFKHTLVFVAFSGEEQGLFGSTALAKRAKAEKWQIDAVLSNDTVGSSHGAGRVKDKKRVRLYSEEVATHQSRELARAIDWFAKSELKGFAPWLVFRKDRFQRGGDHTPFNNEGFTAVRFVEAVEALADQHTEHDTADKIDYCYLSNVVKLNLLTASNLALAGPQPLAVKYDAKQAYDTKLTWTAIPGVSYVVYWRETNSPVWQKTKTVGEVGAATIKSVNKDDHTFAVGAVGGIPVSAEPKA